LDVENAKKLKEQRIKWFRQATKGVEIPDVMPQISNTFTWKIVDEGYKLSEAIYDYTKMEDVVRKHQERYSFDMVRDVGTRNGFKMVEGWADLGDRYVIDDEHGCLNVHDMQLMLDDEWDELLADPDKFMWEKILPRRFPEIKRTTPEDMQRVVSQFQGFMAFGQKMNAMLVNEYGVPAACQFGLSASSHEKFTSNLRGIKQTGIDQRRYKSKMLDAIRMFNEREVYPGINAIKANPGENLDFAFDAQGGCLSYTLLSIPQWEEMYWPTFKEGLMAVCESGKTEYLFIQGDFTRFIDYFKDIPAGHICIHVENGDFKEIHKQLPNIALAGGMPITLLGPGTKQECIDYAKMLLEEVGPKGFVMSQDKILSYPSDATRENLLAVTEFTRNYKAK